MKSLLIALALTISALSQAATVPANCTKKAEAAVEKSLTENYYDKNGFDAYECNVAPNNKAVICDVLASKGEGDAMDTFRVVMNSTCSKVFSVKLTGEE